MRHRFKGVSLSENDRLIKFIVKPIRNIAIQKRLIISFSIIPIISVLLIGFLSYSKSKDAIYSKIEKYSSQILEVTNQNLKLNISNFERSFDEFMMAPIIQYGLDNYKRMSYEEKLRFNIDFDKFLSQKFSLLVSATEIELISTDGSIVYTQGFKYFKKEDIERYSKAAKNEGGRIVWFHTTLNGENHIAMARALKAEGTDIVNGYLFIAVRENVFSAPFYNVDLGQGGNVLLIDGDGKILSAQRDSVKSGNYIEDTRLVREIKDKRYGSIKSIELKKEKYLLNYSYMPKEDWYLISLIPLDYIYQDIINIKNKVIVISLACLFAIILISVFIYSSISMPLQKLVDSMGQVMNNNLQVKICDESKDELGVIARTFNNMVSRINKLIVNIKEEQEVKRDMEIRMLQAQINPHFLFNTLNSFKWIAMMNQDYTVSEGLGALSILLRNTIVDKKELVTIEAEIENVKNYIIIQKIRYGDSFNVEYNIEKDVLNMKIIKFILQPIVENSIIHGFDENATDQILKISASRCEGKILILIEDNGKGFKDEGQVSVDEEENYRKKKLAGIGIKNIEDRIKLTFGNEYGIQISTKLGEGTKVEILIAEIE